MDYIKIKLKSKSYLLYFNQSNKTFEKGDVILLCILMIFRYRNVLMEIIKSPETELADSLKAFVEASMYFRA